MPYIRCYLKQKAETEARKEANILKELHLAEQTRTKTSHKSELQGDHSLKRKRKRIKKH